MKSIRTIGAALLITVLGFGGTVMTAGAASAAPGPASMTVSNASSQDLTHWGNGRNDRCNGHWGDHKGRWGDHKGDCRDHDRGDHRNCDHRRHW